MNTCKVVLALLPGRIDVLHLDRGRVRRGARAAMALGADPASWTTNLAQAADEVRGMVQALGLAGAAAHVLYKSPTLAVDTMSLSAKSEYDAKAAAMLGLTETLGYPADQAVVQAVLVDRRRAAHGCWMQVVAASDRDETLTAMHAFVRAVGLRVRTITPIEAAALARLTSGPLSMPSERSGFRSLLQVGQESSFFLLADEDKVHFCRTIAIGTESLATSLTRPLHGEGGGAPLDRNAATRLLFEHGIPLAQGQAPALPGGLKYEQFMPLLQPVLQRLIVELRQSLRFGMREPDRARLTLEVRGLGAAVPGLGDLIAQELKIAVTTSRPAGPVKPDDPCCPFAEVGLALEERSFLRRLNLLPRRATQSRRVALAAQWLWIGGAAAAVMIGAESFRAAERLAHAREQAQAILMQASVLETLRATTRKLEAAVTAANDLQAAVSKEMDGNPDLRALLVEFSRITPPTVRYTSLSVRRVLDRLEGQITGLHQATGHGSDQAGLDAFVASLSSSPLVSDVTLRSVQFTGAESSGQQRFDMAFRVVPIPQVTALSAAPAAGVGEAR